MKKKVIILITVLLNACSSPTKKIYYHLPVENNSINFNKKYQQDNKYAIWIQQVSLPDHLADNGLVYQTNDVEYIIINNDLWVNPLVQQLKQTMICNLSKNPPRWFISDLPLLVIKKDKLNIIVKKIQGRYDGKAVISGEWILEYRNHIIKHYSNFILAQKQDGYDKLFDIFFINYLVKPSKYVIKSRTWDYVLSLNPLLNDIN
ncbi:ABC-type transport auxiliary lipoprotein family protein [Candidatus Pantoea edessiphila]|uniref:ABC-type transport auxiliary lipoprotein family protein n=1 Tax=Candidatus Pantoea edessiphila TaxID=2044610 RepID=UPI001319CB97|nr:ABC-type transport auxiliary lipoprotein family protein [Candidatus Pantoea edessiphila]